ncbi:MAG: 4-phosphoerythronate dehydrogenase [Myxococcales bacterium]|nr:4-phosphoerythronate dehydrogenase [Myxococcales bacterium]
MARLKIVADANIPYVAEAFGSLGEVVTLPARELDAERLQEADLVLVRSTVKVNEALLGASRARFVATATIGTDHLDVAWLESRGIAWAAAPGSNADSVAQWVASALLTIAERRRFTLGGLTVGVVGVGAIGSRVEGLARALGCTVLRCDPPRERAEGGDFVPLDDLLEASVIVTFHVPLIRDGVDATFHLLDRARIERLDPRAIVVNASRGPVVDTAALALARREQLLAGLILDVFEGEPDVPPSVIAACDLATPHIAGHSLDGKANGTLAIYQAACAHLGVTPRWTPRRALPPPPLRRLVADARALTDESTALMVLRRFYAIEQDDAAMRQIAALPEGERGIAFQRYRASYPERREPAGLDLQLLPPRPRAVALLAALGVNLVQYGGA